MERIHGWNHCPRGPWKRGGGGFPAPLYVDTVVIGDGLV